MQTLKFRTLYFGQKSEFRTINVWTKINISDRSGQNFGGNINLDISDKRYHQEPKYMKTIIVSEISFHIRCISWNHLTKFDQKYAPIPNCGAGVEIL